MPREVVGSAMSFFQVTPQGVRSGFEALLAYLNDEDDFRYCIRRLCELLRYQERGQPYYTAWAVKRIVRGFEYRQQLPRFLSTLPTQTFIQQLEDHQLLYLPVNEHFLLAVQ